LDKKPGLAARLKLRWRVWRRDPALMQEIARSALMRTGVCDESDSMIRFGWDRASGQLIIMIYLSHFDHAAWTWPGSSMGCTAFPCTRCIWG
jgi:hypothetical protein